MILMIDNYDSFVFNLVQYFGELHQEVKVVRNDRITLEQIEAMAPQQIILSPGPCSPDQAGISLELVRNFAHRIPILGVCLGHQTIAQAFGARVGRAQRQMHGKTSAVYHYGHRLFSGVPNPFTATRYHSLIVDADTVPDCLDVIAETDRGEIMAVAHRYLPLVGVQFHPEAILTEGGHKLLENFLSITAAFGGEQVG